MNSEPANSILENLRDIFSGKVNLVRTSKQKKSLIVLIVSMVGLVLGLVLVQRVQEIREKAFVGGPDLFFANSPFSLQPSATNNVFDIFMNTNGFEVTAAVIEVQFDANMIQITSISKGTALTDVLVPGTVSGNRASITLGSGPTTPFNGTGKVATLIFNAGSQGGQTDITFTPNTQVAAIGQPGDVLGTTSPGRVIIGFTSTPTPTPTNAPTKTPTPTTNPTVPPPPSTDAIAHWKFDEGSGFNAIDSSGNNNTGTINGATWTSFGRYNSALVFEDGVGDQVLVKTNLMSPLAGTISAWARAEEFEPVPQYIFGHSTTPRFANRLQIYTDDTTGQLDIGVGDNHTAAVGVFDLEVKRWYHVALTWENDTFRVYVNGGLVHTGTYSGLTTLDPVAAIGNAAPDHPSQSWNGTIDEINIYNRELSAGEIALLAGVGTGTPTPIPTGSTPPSSPLTGDINGDGVVNILDFQILNNNFGTSDSRSDLNNDGVVNILDFQIISNNFGKK